MALTLCSGRAHDSTGIAQNDGEIRHLATHGRVGTDGALLADVATCSHGHAIGQPAAAADTHRSRLHGVEVRIRMTPAPCVLRIDDGHVSTHPNVIFYLDRFRCRRREPRPDADAGTYLEDGRRLTPCDSLNRQPG